MLNLSDGNYERIRAFRKKFITIIVGRRDNKIDKSGKQELRAYIFQIKFNIGDRLVIIHLYPPLSYNQLSVSPDTFLCFFYAPFGPM